MSDTGFGESYRKEVQDVNEGRAQAKSVGVNTVSRTSAGKQHTKLDTRSKLAGIQELATASGNLLSGIKKRQDQEALDQAYATGSQEKLDKLQEEESGFFQNVFGKSAKMKGFEAAVVDHETTNDYQNRLSQMPQHAQQFKSLDEYREAIGDPLLKAALEKQSDPDVRAQITKNFTENTKVLAGQFVKHRTMYEQVLRKKQTLNNVLQASRTFKLAEASGDSDVQNAAKSSMGKAVQRHPDMDEQAWENTITTALVDRLGNSDLSLLQVMEKENKLTFFDIANKQKIQHAKEIYTRENDTRFLTKGLDLQQDILKQADNFEPKLAAYKKQYPQINVNKFRADFEMERLKQNAAAQQVHTDKLDILAGRTPSAPRDSQRKARATRAAEAQLANDAAMAERGQVIHDQQIAGEPVNDLNAAMTQKESEVAVMKAPKSLVNMWRTSGVAPALVTKSLHELDNLILSDELTVDDEPRVVQLTEFLNHFNDNPNDAALFAKNVKSKQQLANFKQLNFLMNKTGRATRESIVMMRLNRKKELPEFDAIQTRQFANEALREFTDNNGFENWLGWSSHPDNQQDLELAAASAFEDALAIVKNPAEAKNLVQDFLTFDSTKVGNKFVLGGADLDTNSYGGSYNDYVQAVQVSEQWKSKQFAAGFPRDRLITDERNTITVFPNGQGAVITSFDRHGNTIYVDLPAPTNQHDWPSTQQPRRPTEPLDFNEPVPLPENPTPVTRSTPGESAPTIAPRATISTGNFTETLKGFENNKSQPKSVTGWDGSTWTPHKSLEGGTKTLAYGHKLTPSEVKSGTVTINGKPVDFNKGLTDAQASTLLEQDVQVHRTIAKKAYPKLTGQAQDAMTMLIFQGANIPKWPNSNRALQKAIKSDKTSDWLGAMEHILNSKWATKQTAESRVLETLQMLNPEMTPAILKPILDKFKAKRS